MPIVPLTVIFAAGILLAHGFWQARPTQCSHSFWLMWQHTPAIRWGLSAAPLLLLPLVFRYRRTRFRGMGVWAPIYLLLGMALYTAHPFYPCLPPHHVGHWARMWGTEGYPVMVTGVVSDWPEEKERATFYRIQAETLHVHGRVRPVIGDVLVKAPRYPAYRYGDRVRAVGTLRLPPVFDDFDYRRYLARQGIYATLRAERVVPLSRGHGRPFWRALYAVRRQAAYILDVTLPPPYAALAQGILLGIESGIPRSLYRDFNATGTSHIIVISGFNIAIVTGLILALLAPLLGRRRAALVAIVGVALYVLFVGADAAVLRAGIMGGVYASSLIVRRRPHVLNTLFFAGMVMLALSPLTLWDVGFQLSFLATLGLILIAPLLQRPVRRVLVTVVPPQWYGPVARLIDEAVVITLAAQLATTPLIIAVFGRTSLVAPVSNLLILPVQPLIMVGAALGTVAGWVWLPLGKALALVAWVPLAWTVWVVEKTARWPGAGVATPAGLRPLVFVYYALFGLFVAREYIRLTGSPRAIPLPSWRGFPLFQRRAVAPFLFVGLVLITAGTRSSWTSMVRLGQEHVFRLRGTTLVWQTRQRVSVTLFGTATSWSEDTTFVDSPVWVVTHTDARSLAFVRQALQDHRPTLLILPALCVQTAPCPPAMRSFLVTVDAWGIPRGMLSPRTPFRIGDGGTFLEYLPGGADVHPVLLHAGEVTVFFPADVPVAWQDAWADRIAWPSSLVLPLPLPESGTWPTSRFLRAARPRWVLLPLGVTYPPSSRRAVATLPAWAYDPDEGIDVRVGRDGRLRR